mgnify:CR=1 FL=1
MTYDKRAILNAAGLWSPDWVAGPVEDMTEGCSVQPMDGVEVRSFIAEFCVSRDTFDRLDELVPGATICVEYEPRRTKITIVWPRSPA